MRHDASTGVVMVPGADMTVVGILGAVILTLVSLVAWVIRQVVSGGLVPRQTYDDLLRANEKMQERGDLQAQQLAVQAEAIMSVRTFVESLPGPARRRAVGGS